MMILIVMINHRGLIRSQKIVVMGEHERCDHVITIGFCDRIHFRSRMTRASVACLKWEVRHWYYALGDEKNEEVGLVRLGLPVNSTFFTCFMSMKSRFSKTIIVEWKEKSKLISSGGQQHFKTQPPFCPRINPHHWTQAPPRLDLWWSITDVLLVSLQCRCCLDKQQISGEWRTDVTAVAFWSWSKGSFRRWTHKRSFCARPSSSRRQWKVADRQERQGTGRVGLWQRRLRRGTV